MSHPLFRQSARLTACAAVLAPLALGFAAHAAPRTGAQSIQVVGRGPIVTGLTLIDADTDRPVRGYDPIPAGATLNLASLPRHLNVRANTEGGVGSVRFDLDGGDSLSTVRVESESPFALCSNHGSDFLACDAGLLSPGSHRLSATPSSGEGGSGTLGSGVAVNFTVIRSQAARPARPPAVTGLTLIDADTDRPVRGYDPIPAGATLRLSFLPRHLNVRANTDGGVGSVVFSLDGASNHLENEAPFALCTDGRFKNGQKGDYFACGANVFAPGAHRFTATPYTKMFAGGSAGQPLAWEFTVER